MIPYAAAVAPAAQADAGHRARDPLGSAAQAAASQDTDAADVVPGPDVKRLLAGLMVACLRCCAAAPPPALSTCRVGLMELRA